MDADCKNAIFYWFQRKVFHCSMEDSWECVFCVEQNCIVEFVIVKHTSVFHTLQDFKLNQTDICYPTFLAEEHAADTAVPKRLVSTSMFVILSRTADC